MLPSRSIALRSNPKLADVARAIELRAGRVIGAEFSFPQARAAVRRLARQARHGVVHVEELPAGLVVRASTGPTPR